MSKKKSRQHRSKSRFPTHDFFVLSQQYGMEIAGKYPPARTGRRLAFAKFARTTSMRTR